MTAATYNITVEQNATFKRRFNCLDKIRMPMDLTGYAAHMQIRDTAGAVICDLSTENGKIVLGGLAGTIDLTIPLSETSLFTFTTAAYDLKLTEPDLTQDRVVQGVVSLSPGVTA
jgi:hypothetical protein